jgi:hypothetical protein
MKSLAMKTNAVNPMASFSYPILYPVAFTAWRGAAGGEPTAKQVDGKVVQTGGLFSSVWNAIMSPSLRSCVECLVDISKEAERCPHCRALQNSEADLLSRSDAGWH